jgi:hypothetical protein
MVRTVKSTHKSTIYIYIYIYVYIYIYKHIRFCGSKHGFSHLFVKNIHFFPDFCAYSVTLEEWVGRISGIVVVLVWLVLLVVCLVLVLLLVVVLLLLLIL